MLPCGVEVGVVISLWNGGIMASPVICVLTVHGVGFQQAPQGNIPGYADLLHQRLGKYLGSQLLGDDPIRLNSEQVAGPVYVQSTWPPTSDDREAALSRLGTWRPDRRAIDPAQAPLTTPGHRIAHVALVYSHLEEQGPRLGSMAEAGAKAAFSLEHYNSVAGAARMAFADARAMLEHHVPARAVPPSSLRVRADAPRPHQRLLRLVDPKALQAAEPNPGLLATIEQLEDDVASYVCRNDMRERVRAFVREALLRLIYRRDVAGVIVNAHSQGTVVLFDVLSQLAPSEARKIRLLITAGSPLRKYTDVFCWGNEIGSIAAIQGGKALAQVGAAASGGRVISPPWVNFWDAHDPVADPLDSAIYPRQAPGAAGQGTGTLLRWIDPATGDNAMVRIDDRQIDNVTNSIGGGLQAHNYWDNEPEFVEPLAVLAREFAPARARRTPVKAQPVLVGAPTV